jgi:hypothetical protein
MKKVILIIFNLILILLLFILCRMYFGFNQLIAWIILFIGTIVIAILIYKFKIISKEHFGKALIISITLIIIVFVFLIYSTLVYRISDCRHNYIYKARVINNTKDDTITIKLSNVGNLIFRINGSGKNHSIKVFNSQDSISVSGNYFCSCGFDINNEKKLDSIPIEIIKNNDKKLIYKLKNEFEISKERGIILINLKDIIIE